MSTRLPLEGLVSLPNFYLVSPSWQRDRVAFYWDKSGRIELYVMDLPDGTPRQLSHGEVPRSLRTGFAWSRDGRTIVFGRDRDGDEMHDLFRIDVESGSVTRLTEDGDTQYHILEFSPDDRWMAVLAATRSGRQLNLFVMRPDGSEVRRLTNFARPFEGGHWSPDGQWLVGSTSESSDPKNRGVYIVRSDGTEVRRALSVRDGSKDFARDWHPDGRHLSVTSDASGTFRPGILNLETGEVRWLGEEGVEEYAGRFSPEGRLLSTIRNQDSVFVPVIYDLQTGEGRTLRLPPGVAGEATFVLDGRAVLITHHASTRRPEAVLYDLQEDTYATALPAEYGSIDPALFVDHEYVWFPSSDGMQIPAILYRPHGVRANGRLPAVVAVHGGPTSQWFRGWDPYAQFLANRGYVVIEPNVRGSTGYGVRFRDMNIKDWGGGDLEDVTAAARYLQRLPDVDPGRIGIFGGSYGGYMTNMAVTKKPDLWKAAVSWVGISDLHKLFEEDLPHFKDYFREQMGDPVADHDLWRERSAITYAEQLTAKLLIVHGHTDPRCPITQARIFRERLLELGRIEGEDFEYVEFADEGHGSQDIQQKLRFYGLLEDFFARRL